jgi:hypothetical protein
LFMTDFFCAILRGEPVVWPADAAERAAGLFELARDEGVHLLIARRLAQEGGAGDCPVIVRALFAQAFRDEAVVEQVVRHELREVIAALSAEGITPLLFKGAALAFTHYPNPVLRPRVDNDLLIRPQQIRLAGTALERIGYERPPAAAGTLVSYQVPYSKTDRFGIQHALDLHWKIANPQVFADTLPVEYLAARAVPVPPLGEAARAVGPVDALALACIHRVAHHHDERRLIWLYDIHLLAGALTAAEAEEFLSLAEASRIRAVCARGCSLAQARFGTSFPVDFADRLAAGGVRDEPSAGHLRGGMRKVDVLLSDLGALDRWSDRWRLLQEHVFPPADYMQQKYGVSTRAWLPLLYARRFVGGAGGWFQRKKGRQRDGRGDAGSADE